MNLVPSMGAQAFMSAFHFALNMYLFRSSSASDYGLFAFAFVGVTFGPVLNAAVFAGPGSVYVPVKFWPARRRYVENMLFSDSVILTVLVFAISAGLGYSLEFWLSKPALRDFAYLLLLGV